MRICSTLSRLLRPCLATTSRLSLQLPGRQVFSFEIGVEEAGAEGGGGGGGGGWEGLSLEALLLMVCAALMATHSNLLLCPLLPATKPSSTAHRAPATAPSPTPPPVTSQFPNSTSGEVRGLEERREREGGGEMHLQHHRADRRAPALSLSPLARPAPDEWAAAAPPPTPTAPPVRRDGQHAPPTPAPSPPPYLLILLLLSTQVGAVATRCAASGHTIVLRFLTLITIMMHTHTHTYTHKYIHKLMIRIRNEMLHRIPAQAADHTTHHKTGRSTVKPACCKNAFSSLIPPSSLPHLSWCIMGVCVCVCIRTSVLALVWPSHF